MAVAVGRPTGGADRAARCRRRRASTDGGVERRRPAGRVAQLGDGIGRREAVAAGDHEVGLERDDLLDVDRVEGRDVRDRLGLRRVEGDVLALADDPVADAEREQRLGRRPGSARRSSSGSRGQRRRSCLRRRSGSPGRPASRRRRGGRRRGGRRGLDRRRRRRSGRRGGRAPTPQAAIARHRAISRATARGRGEHARNVAGGG